MDGFRLFPQERLYVDYPDWIWFSGIMSIAGSVVSGCMMLYLISIDASALLILFYFVMSIVLPLCGHGLLNLKKWAKSSTLLAGVAVVVITLISGVHRVAFADIQSIPPPSPGLVDKLVVYGWILANVYIVSRILMDRGEQSLFNLPRPSRPDQGTFSLGGPIYYYVFVFLWFGLLLAAFLHHVGAVSLPLWSFA